MSKAAGPNEGSFNKHDYYAVCDICGQRFWASTMKTQWDGAFVDDQCWSPYQDGDRSKVVKEDRRVPIARPRLFNADENQLATTPITGTSSNDGKWYVVE